MRLVLTSVLLIGVSVLCCAAILFLLAHRSQDDEQAPEEIGSAERDVIAWAEKNGMRIDEWEAGHVDPYFDEQAWVAEGRAKPYAEKVLQKLLVSNDPPIEPFLVVQALGAVGTADSVPLLVEQVEEAKWQVLRMEAIASLGKIGASEAVRPLVRTMWYDGDRYVRLAAADALVEIGDPAAIEALESALGELRDEEARIEKDLAELREKIGETD